MLFSATTAGVSALLVVTFIVYIILAYRRAKSKLIQNGIPYLGARISQNIALVFGSYTMVDLDKDLYNDAKKTKAPLVAFGDIFGTNSLYVTNIDLIRSILVKDFDHFVNHRPVLDTKVANKLFRKLLFSMENDQWKRIRAKISPAFTTGRIKRMSQIFQRSSSELVSFLEKNLESSVSEDVDLSKYVTKFALDVIASCAFGIDSNTWSVPLDRKSDFETMGHKLGFTFSGIAVLKFLGTAFFPKFMDYFEIDGMDYQAKTYFENVIKSVVKHRRESGTRREDFLQLMIDIQDGLVKADEESENIMNGNFDATGEANSAISNSAASKVTFDDDDLVANGLLFIMAGLDTVSSAVMFTLYSIAVNTTVQDKLFEEISKAKDKHGGNLDYDTMQDIGYLDMVVNETLRCYPPSTSTDRFCTKAYQVPSTNTVIEKGQTVNIPTYGLHHDPDFFPQPEKFLPERWSPEEKGKRNPYTFLAFGSGPRMCIGMRFALVEVKMVLMTLVHAFHFEPCSRTIIPMEFDKSINVKPKNGLWLNGKRR